jgi:putative proteasome-type protease
VNFDVSFLFGGQIMGERMRLFMVYSAGNFIECTTDTPYLQIGEHKYGKPVLDRAITYEMDLYDALKVGLVSIDSTMRSNLSVGMPIDLLVVRRDTCDPELIYRIEPGEPYFTDLRERWSAALRAAHIGIPRPPYSQPAKLRTGPRPVKLVQGRAASQCPRLADPVRQYLPAVNETGGTAALRR